MPNRLPTTTQSAPRVRLAADDRREQILAAARVLFGRQPYESVSTGDIAELAGTTRTNVHYYFGTKRELFLKLIAHFSQIPDEFDGRLVEGSVRDKVSIVLGRWLDGVERNREIFLTMLNASSSVDTQVSGALTASMHAWASRLLAILDLDVTNPVHLAMAKSYQAMIWDATESWLSSETMSKGSVHALLTECLLAVGQAARR